VGHVLIDQRVHRFSTLAFHADQPGAPEHPKVLRHQRLAHLKLLDELVDVTGPLG
jgi:hypothetical protein